MWIKWLGFLVYWLPWPIQRDRWAAGVLGGVGLLVVLAERWLIVPADTFWNLAMGFALNAVLSAALAVVAHIRARSLRGASLMLYKLAVLPLVLGALAFAEGEMLHAGAYQALGQVKVQESAHQALSEVDLKSIVVVPEQTAANKGRQVVGAYGSQFSLGQFYLQRVKEDLVWVAPLEFASFTTQTTAGSSPGYVVVSATDMAAPARLVTGYKLRYMQEAYSGQWLDRYLRGRYPDLVFVEASFELDDEGRPYWVMSAGHYTLGRGAVQVDRALVLDPQTGETRSYALNEVPAWADQVVPARIAAQYSAWWGAYSGGWFNSIWAKRGVKQLTEVGGAQHMVGVNGADGRFYWFSGMTSPNPADTSLIGYMMVDARSGAMTFHTLPGIASEEYVEGAVANAYKAQRYAAGYPLPYNIYGQFTWVVPVLDSLSNGQLMGVTTVRADGGNIAAGKSLDESLRIYKSGLGAGKAQGPTGSARQERFDGTVERIAPVVDQNVTVYYLVLKEKPGKVFSAPLGLSPHLPVSGPGDRVEVEYAETSETLVPVTAFRNLNLQGG